MAEVCPTQKPRKLEPLDVDAEKAEIARSIGAQTPTEERRSVDAPAPRINSHQLPPLNQEAAGESAPAAESVATVVAPKPPAQPRPGGPAASPKEGQLSGSRTKASSQGATDNLSGSGASTADTATSPGGGCTLAVQAMDSEKRKSLLKERQARAPASVVEACGNSRQFLNQLYYRSEQVLLWKALEEGAAEHAVDAEENQPSIDPQDLRGSVRTLHWSACAQSEVEGHRHLVTHELAPEQVEMLGALDAEEAVEDSTTESSSHKEAVLRRQSAYILAFREGEGDREDNPAIQSLPSVGELAPQGPMGGAPVVALPSNASNGACTGAGVSPLKALLLEKKVKVDMVRSVLEALSAADVKYWLESPVDTGPPIIPKPLVNAVAECSFAVVKLLIEFQADVRAPYVGKTKFKGWIMPGSTLIDSVHNRKGRFVGTMLADKLTSIEELLQEEIDRVEEAEPQEAAAAEAEAVAEAAAAPVEPESKILEDKDGRKSILMFTDMGQISITHTQGHPRDCYEIMDHLGDGDTSVCWEAFHRTTRKAVAVKAEQKSDEAWIWEEINIMRKISHPNVICLHETFESLGQIFMVLELCEGGRLFDALIADTVGTVKRTCKSASLMRQLAEAIRHIHFKHISHRDIQLENFLLSTPGDLSQVTPKLIDFTTAKEFGPDSPMKTKICTPSYVAKEILKRDMSPYSEKVDVWSLGVIYYIMLCGSPPFYGKTEFETLKKVKRGNFKYEPEEAWAEVPDHARELVGRMICTVEDRMSAEEVLAHPWFASCQS